MHFDPDARVFVLSYWHKQGVSQKIKTDDVFSKLWN